MTLAEARERAIDRELAERLDSRRREVVGALVAALGGAVLWLTTLDDPAGWARGSFFNQGGLGHDHLGFAGAVLLVRIGLAAFTTVSLWWFLRVARDLTWGRRALRQRIALRTTVFDPPER